MSPHTTRAPGDRRCRHDFPAGLTARFAGRRQQPGRRRRPCAAGSRRPPRWVCGKPPHHLSGRRACPIYGWRLALAPAPLSFTAGERQNRLFAAALDERAELIASPATNSAPADGPGAPACLALADTAPCPVLAVPLTGRWRPTAGGSTICGIDGSDWSATAARTAARLAMALGTRLELVHVVTPPKNRAVHHATQGVRSGISCGARFARSTPCRPLTSSSTWATRPGGSALSLRATRAARDRRARERRTRRRRCLDRSG